MRPLNVVVPTLVSLVFLLSIGANRGCRLLNGEQEAWVKKQSLLLLSVERGPVSPSGSNGGTYIPASSTTTTTVGQKNFAGHATQLPPPPARVPVVLQSLQRGTVPGSGPGPGTYIPSSTLGQRGFAGHAKPPPPPPPRVSVLLQSLPRGPVSGSGPGPGTHIPSSTLGQRGFAGHAMPPPPPPPSPPSTSHDSI